ncbi:DUF4167 domain-containing protein [uncultured Tateyamaria sp.]|uniref:DUF4167 domain-containing protein n=1 Tax=uncultured Tateyamaria sp. TaxID=455651 RepID=UPI0026153226|nr:DUF4167 domain-containing protein [uncultured Tateyamaria sp.]
MKSSRSRSRSKNNRSRNNNSGGGGNVVNRVFDSSGPEGKVRGTPQQIIDKYNQLARDAQLSGDRVATENFQQHAEHYLRMLSEAQREIDARREEQDRQNRERQAEQDRQNRERQAERDRERAARQEQEAAQPAPPSDPTEAPQPDVVEAEGDSGLVETPESKPKPKPRTRTRKPKAPTDEETPTPDSGSAPEAAE